MLEHQDIYPSNRLALASGPAMARACAAALILGAVILTSIGGEAGGDRVLPWLAALGGMTLIWIVSLIRAKELSPLLLLGTAVAIRLVFLCMPTGGDVYRYVWEGRMLVEGFNPYIHPPTDPQFVEFRDEIWSSVGHPHVTAIYPPLAQWLFAVLVSLGLGPFGFKAVFAAADMILCGVLCAKLGSRSALIYAWNPLAAVSFAGGGHYDSVFMLAMVFAWICWQRHAVPPIRIALLIGAAIALKWMALPLGLWLVLHEWRRHGTRPAVLTGMFVALPAVCGWVFLSAWTGAWSLQLAPPAFTKAARSAELIPAIGDFVFRTGAIDNRWFLGVLIVSWIWVAAKNRTFLGALEWSFFATYVLSPMLHAWYFVWVLPCAAKTKNHGYIALAASGITYYLVHHTLSLPEGKWGFSWWERALIWIPFVVGFLLFMRGKAAARMVPRQGLNAQSTPRRP